MIANGVNTPVNVKTGTIPDVSGAMRDWFQPMVFGRISKQTIGFQVVETVDETDFRGVIQPLSDRRLALKPEGQRAWTWLQLHSDPVLTLEVDDIIFYRCLQARVMARRDYTLYGYVEYELVQDWQGADLFASEYFGGNAFTNCFQMELFGGDANKTGPMIIGGDALVS